MEKILWRLLATGQLPARCPGIRAACYGRNGRDACAMTAKRVIGCLISYQNPGKSER
jgi:hypothetical protein